MKLSKFWVRKYGTFKKGADFDLAYNGITTIFGLNKDAGAAYTNASGKSQLFNVIPEIAFGSPPSGKDQTKHSDAEIGVEFVDPKDKTRISFTKTYGKSKKFEVLKNGKSINVRTLAYAEKKLQQYLGGTEEDFYTTRYIDNTIPHPLIVGKAAVRQDFFVRMFNLETVDAVRQLLLAQLREVQKSVATYAEIKSLFTDLKAKSLSKEQIDTKQARIDELKSQQDSLLKKLNKYQIVRDLVRFEEQNKKLISQFHKVTSFDTFEDDWKALKRKRKTLHLAKEAGQEWKTYRKQLKTFKEETSAVRKKIEDLIGKDYDVNVLTAKDTEYGDAVRLQQSLLSILDDLTVAKPDKVDDPKVDKVDIEKKVYRLQEELENAQKFKGGKCPTCGAPHKSRKVDDIDEELSAARKLLKRCTKYEVYCQQRKEYVEAKGRYDEITDRLETVEAKVSKLHRYAKAAKLVAKLPAEPSKPTSEDIDLADVESQYDTTLKSLSKFDQFQDVLDMIRKVSKLTLDQREAATSLDQVTDKLAKISNQLSQLTAEVTTGKSARQQLKELATRGKVLKSQVEDEPILKALIEGYSKKGLKKMLIQKYASILQTQVNKFVRLFFAEDIRFEFKYETKLDVLAHHKKGKAVSTTDVKRLSGAEKRMFTLVLVVATLSLLPKNKRSNFLILDEPEANLGPEAVATFIKALPILNKIVPHIIVITPRPELEIPGSRTFTVVKRNGISTLVKGKVSS